MGNSPFCTLKMVMGGMPRDQYVQCDGWACTYAVNSSLVNCPIVLCSCPTGACIGEAGRHACPAAHLHADTRPALPVVLGVEMLPGGAASNRLIHARAHPASCVTVHRTKPPAPILPLS